MASDTDDTAVTEFTEENPEQTRLSGVEKKEETDILLLQIKKRKRTEKTKVTKLRHELERVCLKDSELPVIESVIEQLWTAGKCTGNFGGTDWANCNKTSRLNTVVRNCRSRGD